MRSPGGGGGGGSGTPFGKDRSISTVSRFTLNPVSTRSLSTLRLSAKGDPPETRGDFVLGDATQLSDFGDADTGLSRFGASVAPFASGGAETVSSSAARVAGSCVARAVDFDDPRS